MHLQCAARGLCGQAPSENQMTELPSNTSA